MNYLSSKKVENPVERFQSENVIFYLYRNVNLSLFQPTL